jgi:hypothetical protein
LNDDTHVEVYAGLSVDDEVVTGVENAETKNTSKSSAQRSPFMPARPGGNRPQTPAGAKPQSGSGGR